MVAKQLFPEIVPPVAWALFGRTSPGSNLIVTETKN